MLICKKQTNFVMSKNHIQQSNRQLFFVPKPRIFISGLMSPNGVASIFLSMYFSNSYAMIGIQTHVSRVAPNSWDLLKDALLTELPGRGI